MNAEQARKIARLHLDVAHTLYWARERSGLSVETVADRAGLPPDRVITIEEGDTTSLTEIAQLCDAMEITVASVFPDSSDQRRTDERDDAVQPRILRTG